MADTLPITKEFFQSCTNRAYSERRLQFAPRNSAYETHRSPFLYTSENDVLEIMIFKRTIGQMVQECHPILESYLASSQKFPYVLHDEEVDELDDPKTLVLLYYMTVGMMVTTHENHTVIRIHDEIVMKILENPAAVFSDLLLDPTRFIYGELNYLQSILNSNNSKLNKSSSLWTLFKKLFIYCNDHRIIMEGMADTFFADTALRAAELHFSNYYAWNCLRFFCDVCKLQKNSERYKVMIDKIEQFAYTHHTDSSAWSCLTDCICLNKKGLELTCFEYNRHARNSKLLIQSMNLLILYPNGKNELLSLSKWLWENNVVSEIPYLAFRRLFVYNVKVWHERDLTRELISQVRIHCSLFEELKLKSQGIEIGDKRGYLETNIDIEKDYELGQLLNTYFNWKRFLDWFDEFIKDKYIAITGYTQS
jgi:hypothetical protein